LKSLNAFEVIKRVLKTINNLFLATGLAIYSGSNSNSLPQRRKMPSTDSKREKAREVVDILEEISVLLVESLHVPGKIS